MDVHIGVKLKAGAWIAPVIKMRTVYAQQNGRPIMFIACIAKENTTRAAVPRIIFPVPQSSSGMHGRNSGSGRESERRRGGQARTCWQGRRAQGAQPRPAAGGGRSPPEARPAAPMRVAAWRVEAVRVSGGEFLSCGGGGREEIDLEIISYLTSFLTSVSFFALKNFFLF